VRLPLATAVAPLCLLLCNDALAQTAPTAGSLQQQIDRLQPAAPLANTPVIRLDPGPPVAAPAEGGQAIPVARLRISGARAASEATLVAAAGVVLPRNMTLAELRAAAAGITSWYRQHGYFVARAYLPEQDIKDGNVTIAILEGQYGQISVRNSSGVSDRLLGAALANLHQGDAVNVAGLEQGLLTIADIPGADVKSTLVPGASVGSSDLIVDVTPGQRVAGSIDADNHGNRYTGARRVGGSLYVNNPSGHGDLLSARALTSEDGLRYGRMAYQIPLGRTRAALAYSRMRYRLGAEFAALQAHGTASIASLSAGYPLIRSRAANLNAVMSADFKTFRDEADVAATSAAKKARVGLLGLNGNARDGTALNTFALAWTSGELRLDGAAALATDAATVRSNGHFNKVSLQVSRLQELVAGVALQASLNVQLASKNLDTSEKIGLGGAAGVRAYPSGEAFGDQGHILSLELRKPLAVNLGQLPGQLQLIAFADTGSVMLNRSAWAGGPNRRTLSGAGLGLQWEQQRNFSVSATIAGKLGNSVATSAPDKGRRIWIEAVKYF
jgi:hemolysin activation/secretion protein